jgi:hypothetical protein
MHNVARGAYGFRGLTQPLHQHARVRRLVQIEIAEANGYGRAPVGRNGLGRGVNLGRWACLSRLDAHSEDSGDRDDTKHDGLLFVGVGARRSGKPCQGRFVFSRYSHMMRWVGMGS